MVAWTALEIYALNRSAVGMDNLAVDPKKIHRSREEVINKVRLKRRENYKRVMLRLFSRITKIKVGGYNPITKKLYTSTHIMDL